MKYLHTCSVLFFCAALAACAAAPQTQAPAATVLHEARMAASSPGAPAMQPSEPTTATATPSRLLAINGPSPATPTTAPTMTGTATPTPVYASPPPECNVIHMINTLEGWLLLAIPLRYRPNNSPPLYLVNAFPLYHLETTDGGKTWQTVSTDILSLREYQAYEDWVVL